MTMISARSHSLNKIQDHLKFNKYAESSVRNLELLRQVENTCLALRSEEDLFRNLCGQFNSLTADLSMISVAIPEDELIAVLEDLMAPLLRINARNASTLNSARSDRQLRPEDGVVAAYERVIELSNELYEAVSEYRLAIMHHNALKDTSGGKVLSTEEEIQDYLSTL